MWIPRAEEPALVGERERAWRAGRRAFVAVVVVVVVGAARAGAEEVHVSIEFLGNDKGRSNSHPLVAAASTAR